MTADGEAEAGLRAVAGLADAAIDLADTALLFAALDRPHVALDRYRRHLAMLGTAVGEAAEGAGLAARIAAINGILFDREGYDGDRLTYDDQRNANLMHVIDRRRGLPVSLGILYIHAARAQAWPVTGLSFPGRFLLRLAGDGERAVIDPFERGRTRDAADLRALLATMADREAGLDPGYYEPVGNRDVLIRLQTNIKLRHLHNGAVERASQVAERLLWIAPGEARLWQDFGRLQAQLGNHDMAKAALETCIDRSDDEGLRHATARLLREIATHS